MEVDGYIYSGSRSYQEGWVIQVYWGNRKTTGKKMDGDDDEEKILIAQEILALLKDALTKASTNPGCKALAGKKGMIASAS